MMLGPYIPPNIEQAKMIAGAIINERRRAAKVGTSRLQYKRKLEESG